VVSRFDTIAAGFGSDEPTARTGLASTDPAVRASALRALARMDRLTSSDLSVVLADGDAEVRRTAAELAARFPGVDLTALLSDTDVFVAEMAAWAMGEQGPPPDAVIEALVRATLSHGEMLVREAAAAALGALGDPRGLDAIIAACSDKPAVRRRAILALAPFDDPRIEPLLRSALEDRDWQVRQNAEDMLNPRG
jgi:HEAT repeat protein